MPKDFYSSSEGDDDNEGECEGDDDLIPSKKILLFIIKYKRFPIFYRIFFF